jgi:hypothetical protein
MMVSVNRTHPLRAFCRVAQASILGRLYQKSGILLFTFTLIAALFLSAPLQAAETTAKTHSGTSQLIQQWKQALKWRLAFQSSHPEAHEAFSSLLTPEKAKAFLSKWPGGPYSDTGAEAWRTFGASLLHEKINPGSGKPSLVALKKAWATTPGKLFELGSVEGRMGYLQISAVTLESVGASLMEQGYRTAREFSVPLLSRARSAMSQDDWHEANQALNAAAWLDPLSPFIPWTRLELTLREQGPLGLNLGEIWSLGMEAASKWVQPAMGSALLYNVLRTFRLTVMTFFGFFLIALLIRHFTLLSHSTAERLPGSIDFRHRYAAIALTLCGLWVAGVGLVFLALLILPWIWPHAHEGERRKLGWMFMAAFLMPGWLYLENSLLSFQDSESNLHWVRRSWESGYDPNLVNQIETFKPITGEDSANRAMAASLQFKKQGNYLKADQWLEDQDDRLHSRPDYLIQKGNLALLTYQFAKADSFFALVRQNHSGNFEALFNASQSALFQNQSDRHKSLLDRAAALDAGGLTAYLKANDQLFKETPANRRVMDPGLQIPTLLRNIGKDALQGAFLHTEVRGGLISLPGFWFLILTAASFGLMTFRSRREVVLVRGKTLFDCKICGRVMCRQCRKGVHCETCFKTVSGVSDAKVRNELISQLRNKSLSLRSLIGKSLNAIAPGTGDVFLGARGFRFPWLWALSLSLGILLELRRPAMEYPSFALGLIGWLPWVLLLGIYGGYHVFSLLPQPGRDSGGTAP